MSQEEGIKIVSVRSQNEAAASQLCRLCAKNISGESLSIFADNFHEFLEEFLGIQIGRADAWPKSVCFECVRRASEAIEFVREIRESENAFKGLFGANGPVVEFVVTEVAGGVQQDFDDEVEVISDGEVFPEDANMAAEEGEVTEEGQDESILYQKLTLTPPEVTLGNQEDQDDILPAVLAPRRRYKTDEDFRRAEAFYSISCTLCLTHFQRLKELRAHYREAHQMEGYVMCCGKKLFRLTYMLDHMEYHSNQEAFKCDQCGKCLDSQTHLRTHQQQQHPDIYSRRKRVIERLSEFNKHYKSHFSCSLCGREFDYKSAMEKHVVAVHQGGETHNCPVCGKIYKSRISYLRHMRSHEPEESPPLEASEELQTG